MPELPEVETILRGIHPLVTHQMIQKVVIRQKKLRWEIPPDLIQHLENKIIQDITRRGKYLLFHTSQGTLIMHFGMSGYLQLLENSPPAKKHDHFDLVLNNHLCLRFSDARRFGCILWTENLKNHPLLKKLGPEPLSSEFTPEYLFEKARDRKLFVKQFIMNSQVVPGVGNIYATESLYLAKIHPQKKANQLSLKDCTHLVNAIKFVLEKAIQQGGTTLKDFRNSAGKPGYFKTKLLVYGREGLRCEACGRELSSLRIQQRATVFCAHCQKL